jgi:anti-anti-sigma factor
MRAFCACDRQIRNDGCGEIRVFGYNPPNSRPVPGGDNAGPSEGRQPGERPVQVAAKRYADVLVLAVGGRIDYVNADDFKAALMPHLGSVAAGGDHVVLDLSGLEYISSAGLRVLMIAAREARARQGKLIAVALQPVVREIFEISKFTLVFELFDSLQQALQQISPAALAALKTR